MSLADGDNPVYGVPSPEVLAAALIFQDRDMGGAMPDWDAPKTDHRCTYKAPKGSSPPPTDPSPPAKDGVQPEEETRIDHRRLSDGSVNRVGPY